MRRTSRIIIIIIIAVDLTGFAERDGPAAASVAQNRIKVYAEYVVREY